MFTIRNLGGVALFLFGTTFLWLTPSFASPGVPTTGVAWSITQVLALVTIALFTVATWGLFKKAGWWEATAVVAAAVGFVVLIPYWLAASHAGEVNPAFTIAIHVLGNIGVLVLLLVPRLEHWVDRHVLAGR
jgi:glycerol uptake facilitator-like aquaporin